MKNLIIPCIAAICLTACTTRPQWRETSGSAWNTYYHITYKAPVDLADSVIAVMRQVELSLSPFNPESRISKINRGESSQADSLILRVLLASQEVNRLSNGAFDPTVGPLINLWGFGEKGHGAWEPTQAQIDSALALVGIQQSSIDQHLIISKAHPGTTFNFSAITKGLGCDLVGEMLARNGATDYMVEIGGEIALRGFNPRGEKWRIMIEKPVDNDSTAERQSFDVIQATNCGIATSGNYRNFHRQASGQHLGHTISPATGHPISTKVLSATVIAPTCMIADALATAYMATPIQESQQLGATAPRDSIEGFPIAPPPGVAVLLILPDTVITSPDFPPIKIPAIGRGSVLSHSR
ncbi:MAG: FAD:protein FMN transferase [Bacteroidales bacterium]|nr:FAD:protein FMN transferase [Bacteroidales bacterium]